MRQAKQTEGTQRGLTLIELLTTVTLVGILLTLAAPSLRNVLLQRQLHGAVHEYLSQWEWARMQAVARNRPVYLSFGRTAAGTCYLFYIGQRGACDCATSTHTCQPTGQTLVTALLPESQRVEVGSSQSAIITLDPERGTVTPTFTATFSTTNGQAVRAIASITGRTRTCGVNTVGPDLPECS